MYSVLLLQLRTIGVRAGDALMIHASLRKIGKLDGGASALIDALLAAVGSGGTLFVYADFEPTDAVPYFDVARSPCAADHGVFPEIFRRRPGVLRSTNPGARVSPPRSSGKLRCLNCTSPTVCGSGVRKRS